MRERAASLPRRVYGSRPMEAGHRMRWRAGLGLLAALGGAGDGWPGSKPDTPYTLDAGAAPSAAPSAVASDVDAAAPDAGASYAAVPGTKAPGDGKSWPLEGNKQVPAPAGRAFETGLV